MSIQNIQVRPMKVTIGKDTEQVQSITCLADVSSSLSAKYFLFRDSAGAKRYCWIDTGSSVDPAPAGGWVGSAVVIAPNASATAVATAIAAILGAVSGFDATASGSVVTLTHTVVGFAEPAYDFNTGFAFKVVTLGQAAQDAGCLQGSIEISGFEQTKVEITCHDSGTTVRDERISGYGKPVLSFTLQETAKANIEKILRMAGNYAFTPVGADKESIFGYGPSQVGGANPKVLINMHPVSLQASDKSEDYNFWSCEIALESFTFSGEEVSTVPATFNIYPDETKPKMIQFFMIGDATKAGY